MTLKETLLTAWNLLNAKIDFFDFERNKYNIDYTKDIFHIDLNKNQINLFLYDEYILKITSLKKNKIFFGYNFIKYRQNCSLHVNYI